MAASVLGGVGLSGNCEDPEEAQGAESGLGQGSEVGRVYSLVLAPWTIKAQALGLG
jgi:hypothetical protein